MTRSLSRPQPRWPPGGYAHGLTRPERHCGWRGSLYARGRRWDELTDDRLDRLATLLSGALLWGLELDTRYRVLAATVEPSGSSASSRDDPRVQVAFHPCSVFETRLVKTATGGGAVLERFSIGQLLDVVAALNGPALSGVEVDGRPPQWRDVSLEGRSQAPDGRSHRVRFSVSDGGRILEVHATFDDVDARAADGSVLPLDEGQGL